MCNICKKVHSKDQANARKRILTGETLKIINKIEKIKKVLKRKQVKYYNSYFYARSLHTNELIKNDFSPQACFKTCFPYNSLPSDIDINSWEKEDNKFYSFKFNKKIIVLPNYFKYKKEENTISHEIAYNKDIIFYNPSKEDLALLRGIGTEVQIS